MKINNENRTVEANGIQAQGAFTIKTSAQAFQLLSSGLYSNKIKAVIRELACNAADAHKMIKTDKPLEIKIPNSLDQQFYVKDYGPGLSHDNVMKLYTTYFESTKSENDDFTGGFGLGSKSPFAYTDSFTVESRQNGVSNIYTSFVDESGIPNIVLLNTSPTSEPNGLTVGFPVKTTDFKKFEQEAIEVLSWFDTPYILKGTSVTPKNQLALQNTAYQTSIVTIYGQKFEPRQPTYIHSTRHTTEQKVVMGNVAYPLKIQDEWRDNPKIMWLMTLNAIYTWPVGKVSIAVSREELAYDRQSLKMLPKALEEAFHNLAVEIKKQIDHIWVTQTGLERDLRLINLIEYTGLADSKIFNIFADTVGLTDEMKKAMTPKSLFPFKIKTFDIYIPGDRRYYSDAFGNPQTWSKDVGSQKFTIKDMPGFFENIGGRFGKDIETRWTLFKSKQKGHYSKYYMVVPKPNKALTTEYEEELKKWKNELGIEFLDFLPRQHVQDNELMVPAQLFDRGSSYYNKTKNQVLTLETPNFLWITQSDISKLSLSSWSLDGFKKTLALEKMPHIFIIDDEHASTMKKFTNSENIWTYFERELVDPKRVKKIEKIKPMLNGTSSMFSTLRNKNRKDPTWQHILKGSKLSTWLVEMDKVKGTASYDFSAVCWLQKIKEQLPHLDFKLPAYYEGNDIQKQLVESYPLLLQKTLVKDEWLSKDTLQNIANSLQEYVKWKEDSGMSNPPHTSTIVNDTPESITIAIKQKNP